MKKTIIRGISIMIMLAMFISACAFSTVTLKSIKLNATKISLKVGKSYNLKVLFTPQNTTQKRVSYNTSNKGIATVDSTGKIMGVKAGNAVITVVSSTNKKIITKCNVSVQSVKPVKFSFAFWTAGTFGKDAWYNDLSKRLNIDIDFINLDWGDYGQKIRLWAASNELPNYSLIDLPSSDYFTFAKQGLLKQIPNDLSAYPQLKTYMSAPVMNYFKVNNKFYVVPRGHRLRLDTMVSTAKLMVRKDWMTKLGIKDPQTYEDLLKMCKAFVDNKLGGEDTVGYTCESYAELLYPFMHGMGSGANDSWEKVNGQYVPGLISKKNIEWISLLRKYYQLGAIDMDFAIQKSGEGVKKFYTGKAGLMQRNIASTDYKLYTTSFEQGSPDKKAKDAVKLLMFPKNNQGVLQIQNEPGVGTGSIIGANTTDEQLDAILRLLDYTATEEGLKFTRLGKEGRDYKIEKGNLVWTTPKDEASGVNKLISQIYPTSFIGSSMYWGVEFSEIDPGIPLNLRNDVKNYEQYLIKNGVREKRNLQIDWMDAPAKNKWNFYSMFYEGVVKIIVGKEDVTKMFDDLVQDMLKNGGNEAIKEVNEKMAGK